jgi:MoxR-like ATPase
MAKAIWEVEEMNEALQEQDMNDLFGNTSVKNDLFTATIQAEEIIEEDTQVTSAVEGVEMETTGGTALSQTVTGAVVDIKQAIQKLQNIERELNLVFFEREAEIRSMLLGLLTGRHVLLLGPPGTGKSDLSRSFHERIVGSRHFEILMGKTTDPSELLGPLSLSALQQDRFARKYQGYLPDCDTAFIDEIYKGNSATNNILLGILNEGVWFDDGVKKPSRLKFMVAASNEEPEDESLQAFHDRLVFRHWVDYIKDPANEAKMLSMSIARRQPGYKANLKQTTITLEEVEALREYVNTIDVSPAVIQAFQSLMFELSKLGIVVSSRRRAICMQILQANAALEGRNSVLTDDFIALQYVLWQRKDDIPNVETQILKLANPYEEKLKQYFLQAREAYETTMAIQDKTDRANKAIEARAVIEQSAKSINKLINAAKKEGRDITKLEGRLKEVQNMAVDIVNKCLLFSTGLDDDSDEMPF